MTEEQYENELNKIDYEIYLKEEELDLLKSVKEKFILQNQKPDVCQIVKILWPGKEHYSINYYMKDLEEDNIFFYFIKNQEFNFVYKTTLSFFDFESQLSELEEIEKIYLIENKNIIIECIKGQSQVEPITMIKVIKGLLILYFSYDEVKDLSPEKLIKKFNDWREEC